VSLVWTKKPVLRRENLEVLSEDFGRAPKKIISIVNLLQNSLRVSLRAVVLFGASPNFPLGEGGIPISSSPKNKKVPGALSLHYGGIFHDGVLGLFLVGLNQLFL